MARHWLILTWVCLCSAGTPAVAAGGKDFPDDPDKLKKLIQDGALDKLQNGFTADRLAMLLAKHDMPESGKALRALLMFTQHGGGSHLYESEYFLKYPERVARELVPLLKDGDAKVRGRAATVLAFFQDYRPVMDVKKLDKIVPDLAAKSPELVANLKANLEDKDATVRWPAAGALVATRTAAGKDAGPLLVKWMSRETVPHLDGLPLSGVPIQVHVERSNWVAAVLHADSDRLAPMVLDLVVGAKAESCQQLAALLVAWPIDAVRSTLIKALNSEDAELRRFGIAVLERSPGATAMIPAVKTQVQALLEDKNIDARLGAVGIFLRFPEFGYREQLGTILAKTFDDADASVRLVVVQMLRSVGKSSTATRPALEKALADVDTAVSVRAASHLTALFPASAPLVVPALERAIKAADNAKVHDAVDEAIETAARLGIKAASLAPVLLPLVNDANGTHRFPAARTLIIVDPKQTAPVLGLAQDAFESPKVDVRLQAAELIALLGPAAKPALPKARKEFQVAKDLENKVAWAAAIASVEGDRNSPAIAFVREYLVGKQKSSAGEVTFYLKELGPAAKAFVPDLMEMLEQAKTDSQLLQVMGVLGAIGPEARAALPLLQGLLKHKSAQVRDRAQQMIAKIEL